MFSELVKSDEAIKAIFDHFRNVGIAGAVLAAGAWSWRTYESNGFLGYVGIASSISLFILGFFLLALAERHGHRKFTEAKVAWYWELAVRLVYGLTLLTLASNAAFRTTGT